ncbi:MAG: YbaK/EbsC family protein [Spirochaetes bacterium]|nr:YbaK/EbsC family protein [Spirochaetota bacterium]
MKCEKVRNYLDENHIPYQTITHFRTYSAQQTAHSVHRHGKELAKPIIVKVNGRPIMVVVTANQKVNLTFLKKIFSTIDVELASETDIMKLFPDCECGAMPPFGKFYGMDELISEDLTKDDMIYFNAGNHTELIGMKYSDFAEIIHPRVVNFNIRL